MFCSKGINTFVLHYCLLTFVSLDKRAVVHQADRKMGSSETRGGGGGGSLKSSQCAGHCLCRPGTEAWKTRTFA